MKIISRTIIIILFLPVGLYSDEEDINQSFEKHFNLWSESKISEYQYTLQRQCFCPISHTRPIIIEVQNNQVVNASFVNHDEPVSAELKHELETIDEWFALISDAFEREADVISVEYNPEFGYPKMIDIDMRKLRSDDEQVIAISDFIVH